MSFSFFSLTLTSWTSGEENKMNAGPTNDMPQRIKKKKKARKTVYKRLR